MGLLLKSKVLVLSLVLLALNAEAKKAIVFLKEKAAFQQVQNVLNQKRPDGVVAPLGSLIKSSQIKKSLNGINSLIIDNVEDYDISELRKNKNVLLVDVEVKRPLPFPVSSFTRKSLKVTQKQNAFISMTPWGINAVKATEAWNDAKGGAGARVLILDTGVDKDHPSLRPNLELGKDFVGDNQEGYPYKDTIGHGTHVAGTIAGMLDSTGFSGVAPRARFLAGRVCAEDGCSNLAIAEGINWGVEQKVDVISMSLGGAWSTPAERLAISNATEAGVTIVAASGNDGTPSVSFPAALPECIAVGAIDSLLHKADFSQFGPELAVVAPGVDVVSSVPLGKGRASSVSFVVGDEPVQVVKSVSFDGGKLVLTPESNDVVFVELGKEEDFAKVDVQGKVALIQRGEIKFSEKVNNAIQAKATGVIIFNNTDGLLKGAITENGAELPVGVFMVEKNTGEAIRDAIAKGTAVRSTYEIMITNYDSYNGTSMATPHVSGVVALMKAANKNLSPADVKAILQKTSTALFPNDNNELGAGVVNAELAVKASLVK
jgi:subtilisin family serine protease